jgi:hypothetical protein
LQSRVQTLVPLQSPTSVLVERAVQSFSPLHGLPIEPEVDEQPTMSTAVAAIAWTRRVQLMLIECPQVHYTSTPA